MNLVVFSDIESTGKWLATQALLEKLKKIKPDLIIYLLHYGTNDMMLDKALFASTISLPRPPLIPPFPYYRQILLELVSQVKALRSLTLKVKPDLVITTEYSFVYTTKQVLPSTKLIFHFHGFTHFFILGWEGFNLYLFLIKALERISWLLVDRLILPSTNVKPVIRKELGLFYRPNNIQVIDNLLPQYFSTHYTRAERIKMRKSVGIKAKHRVVLYVGRISEKKGLENLFAALPLIRRSLKDILVVIVYPDFNMNYTIWEKLQTVIDAQNLRPSVIFLKNYTRQKLPALYQLADLAILPSELEMNSLFLLESLASGLPILSTASGNAINLLGKVDTSLLLKNSQPVTIARSVIRYFSKPVFWQTKIKKRLRVRFQELDWKNAATDLSGLLTFIKYT